MGSAHLCSGKTLRRVPAPHVTVTELNRILSIMNQEKTQKSVSESDSAGIFRIGSWVLQEKVARRRKKIENYKRENGQRGCGALLCTAT